MKKAKACILLLIIFSASPIVNVMQIQRAHAEATTLSVTSVYNLTQQNSTFLVNITVSDVKNLNLWIINLTFNPEYIQITTGNPKGIQYPRKTGPFYNIFEGNFIKNATSTMFFISQAQGGKISNETGELFGLVCSASTGGASGSGILATINFTLLKVGKCQINIKNSVLQSSTGSPIEHSVVNGVISDEPPPVPPIWMQAWFHQTLIGMCVVAVVIGVYKKFRKKIRQKRLSLTRESEPIYEEKEPTFD